MFFSFDLSPLLPLLFSKTEYFRIRSVRLVDNLSQLLRVGRRKWVKILSLTVFNSAHTPALSGLLLILSASRFLVPDFPLLAPAPFPSSAPLHGITFPCLSDRNPLWTHSNLRQDISSCKTTDLPCFPLRAAFFLRRKSLLFIV